jgi:hypothetical protein
MTWHVSVPRSSAATTCKGLPEGNPRNSQLGNGVGVFADHFTMAHYFENLVCLQTPFEHSADGVAAEHCGFEVQKSSPPSNAPLFLFWHECPADETVTGIRPRPSRNP